MIVVVIDANVLYSKLKRDLLLHLAYARFFLPRWNRTILAETRRNLVNNIAGMSNKKSIQIIQRMNTSFPSALVKNYRVSKNYVSKINQKDKHIAKTAIYVSASGIITEDKNFQSELTNQGLNYFTPDDFIAGIISNHGLHAIPAIANAKNRINSSLNGSQFINILNSNNINMTKTANTLVPYNKIILIPDTTMKFTGESP